VSLQAVYQTFAPGSIRNPGARENSTVFTPAFDLTCRSTGLFAAIAGMILVKVVTAAPACGDADYGVEFDVDRGAVTARNRQVVS
jgi:hypothetical protein